MKKKNGNLFCPCMLAIQNKNVGCRYGKLVVLNTFLFKEKSGIKRTRSECLCDCGNKKEVRLSSLNSGNTISCGCAASQNRTILVDGFKSTDHPLLRTWDSMKNRCLNKNNKSYHNYGGREITVCDRWLNSFSNFVEDMGPKPTNLHSIDRIDNDGNYEPKNCRWATPKEQANNMRVNVCYTYNGETKTEVEWSRSLGGCRGLIYDRIKRGWSVERAVTTRPTK